MLQQPHAVGTRTKGQGDTTPSALDMLVTQNLLGEYHSGCSLQILWRFLPPPPEVKRLLIILSACLLPHRPTLWLWLPGGVLVLVAWPSPGLSYGGGGRQGGVCADGAVMSQDRDGTEPGCTMAEGSPGQTKNLSLILGDVASPQYN